MKQYHQHRADLFLFEVKDDPCSEHGAEERGHCADQCDLKVETAVFKVFPCRHGASEGALELVAAVNIVDRHSAHHISRKRDQAASSGDRVDKSRNEEERAEPDQIMDVFHGYPPCIFAAGR